jgi:hypothetical protein
MLRERHNNEPTAPQYVPSARTRQENRDAIAEGFAFTLMVGTLAAVFLITAAVNEDDNLAAAELASVHGKGCVADAEWPPERVWRASTLPSPAGEACCWRCKPRLCVSEVNVLGVEETLIGVDGPRSDRPQDRDLLCARRVERCRPNCSWCRPSAKSSINSAMCAKRDTSCSAHSSTARRWSWCPNGVHPVAPISGSSLKRST